MVGDNRSRNVGSRHEGDAFAAFFERHHKNVWKMAYLYLRDHHEAEDAVQETFLKAWRGRGQCRADASEHAWLLAIGRNVCIDRLRRRPKGGVPRSIDETGHAELRDLRGESHDEDRRIDLRRALSDLHADEREAWLLVDVLGFKSDEAARIVGVPAASTIRSRVDRARHDLADALADKPRAVFAGVLAADVRGLYHSARQNALVVSLAETPVACGTSVGGRRARPGVAAPAEHGASPSPRQSYLRLYARLEAPAGDVPSPLQTSPCRSVFEFLDRLDRLDVLDRDVAGGRRVLALVETPSRDSVEQAERWRAAHPRWHLHGAPGHRAWQQAVAELLAVHASASRDAGAQRMLALIDAAKPFVWTDIRNTATL